VPERLGFCPQLEDTVASLPRPDLIHIHGLWRVHYAQTARYARRLGVPVVLSLHGMLYLEALAEHRTLKQLARWVYQDRVLRHASCLHATSPEEIAGVRRFGFTGPVALILWGVDTPEHADAPRQLRRIPDARRRTVVYLGRLHPRKGLDVLLSAWSRLGSREGCRLVVAGADSDGYRSTLTTRANALGVADSVEWRDALSGLERERIFDEASVLVLPSAYENFGLVVAEALARGVPAIATQGTPWGSLVEEQCGWWIPFGVEPLTAALSDALARSDAELEVMGERGRRFATARFRWECTAAAMRELYDWLLGKRPQPAFVNL
jgi:glycosyltransferase involved in cell wall biosynthesis